MKGFKGNRWKENNQASTNSAQLSGKQDEHQHMGAATPGTEPQGRKWSAPRKWIAGTAGAVIVIAGLVYAGNQYVNANMVPYYHVLVHNQEIGTVKDPSQIDKLFSQKQQEYQDKYPGVEMVLQTDGITTKVEKAFQAKPDTDNTLKKLDGMLKAYAEGVELKVNGKVVGIVKDQATVDAALEQAQMKFAPKAAVTAASGKDKVETKLKKMAATTSSAKTASTPGTSVQKVSIQEKVTVAPVKADPNKVLTAAEAAKLLTTGQEAPLVYTVEEGDTISTIASQFKISQKEIYSNNPGVKEKYLQIGDQLKLTVPKPPITVKTVEKVTEQVSTAPEIEIRKSKELPAGKTKVVRPGQEGLKVMTYQVTKENGKVVSEQWLGQTVVKSSLKEVVLQGTKVPGRGSGQFAWPVSGHVISSSYGTRWGKMHKGIDMVSGNRTIMAADDGTVTFTGQISGYGNAIIISHGNGYETLYGHLNSISVHSGQKVSQGQKIGIMGSTGHSTGTHLHFEIHKNGSIQNPMKYLN
ncbi:hypothetical protein BCV73_29310 [Paenibacillus sp. SSG-1]|uniref:peptidoglycan DD-metalloendopeptidase family protein n=1 Tax=Paenibacillus sp. SSG-1 TaxID=1443669 RepID=UPI000B7CF4EF|nr:M23 family metallopeptidase [Paenibacillus sp. SSG-1]OXL86718.1 hypothetical protein BCV73_29310 [Paenibacillus sp. SSG-1]